MTDCNAPLVSVILTTRDRPRLLNIALRCYARQSYRHRELIVVDDGEAFPADAAEVDAARGRLIRVVPGTLLGTKLNRGLAEAEGALCQKMDDDDWYAPEFLSTMVSAVLSSWTVTCRPTVAFLMPFLFFDVARWEVRQSVARHVPGATLFFARDAWEHRPFRALPGDEDVWFVLDQVADGATPLPVRAPETFLAVRHAGTSSERGHTWTHQWTGHQLETYLLNRQLLAGGPEGLLPEWALIAYRELRNELLAIQPLSHAAASSNARVQDGAWARHSTAAGPDIQVG
jgi:glycosyltransferase involved in cell wall biosynthesis